MADTRSPARLAVSLVQWLRAFWATAWAFLREVYRRVWDHDLNIMAAALSYYWFLGIVPLLLLFLSVAGFVLQDPPMYDRIARVLVDYVPLASDLIIAQLQSVVHSRGLVGGIGILGLVWLGLRSFDVLERVLNRIWGSVEQRSYLGRKGIALLVLLVSGVLFILSMGATSLVAAHGYGWHVLGFNFAEFAALWRIAASLLPVVFSAVMFGIMYACLPNKRTAPLPTLLGATLAAASWELSKVVFQWAMATFQGYTQLYGSLASVAMLVVWIFTSAMVLLIGAEVAAVLTEHHSATTT